MKIPAIRSAAKIIYKSIGQFLAGTDRRAIRSSLITWRGRRPRPTFGYRPLRASCFVASTKHIGYLTVVTTLLTGSLILAEENNNEDWFNKHASVKTTESIERDAEGNIRSIKIVKDTTVYIKQISTETQTPDKNGNMNAVSRTTTSADTLGNGTTIIESPLPGSASLVTTSITTVERAGDQTITTVYARDKTGNMAVVSKTTSLLQNNGGSSQNIVR